MDPEEDVVPFPLLVNPAPLLALEGQGGALTNFLGLLYPLRVDAAYPLHQPHISTKQLRHTPAIWSEQPNLH